MSKAIRIKEHLYEEIERLAKQERRSLIGQLEILLEQALRMTKRDDLPSIPPESVGLNKDDLLLSSEPQTLDEIQKKMDDPNFDPHFKPDFK